jgi:hypothetical protein
MKLTKSEIKQKQEDLVKVLLQLKRLGESKKSLTAALADDFEANEEKYRNGIVTASGILLRNPAVRPAPGFAEVNAAWIEQFFR